MLDLPTPKPDDVEGDLETAEDLHQQLADAIAEAEKTGDFTKAEEIKRQLEEKLEPLKEEAERREMVFTETFEGKDIKIDVRETMKFSKEFYQEHELQELADNLSEEIKFSAEAKARIKEALKMGFDRAMILPQTKVQRRSLNAVIEQMAKKPHPGLSDQEQSGFLQIDESAKQSQTRNRPAKAYMLMYQSQPIPPETKGKTPDQLETLFQQKKWNGLTMSEYLILQRRELEERKNHSFDALKGNDPEKSQWSWLLDSHVSSLGVVHASWGQGRTVNVDFNGFDRSSSWKGARPTVVVELQ